MFAAIDFPIEGWRTNPCEFVMRFTGFDFTGAAVLFEARDRPDGGTLRAQLTVGTGITIAVETVDGLPITTITGIIPEATMEAMPQAPEVGTDIDIFYGMQITPSGGAKFMACHSKFTIHGTVPA